MNTSKIKAVTINSFSFQATVPPYNTAYLTGYLKENEVPVHQIDVNLIIWETLLSKEFVESATYNHKIIDKLECPFAPVLKEDEFNELKISVLLNLDDAVCVVKSDLCYNFEKFCWAQKVLFETQIIIYHCYGTFFTTHLPYWGNGIGFNYHDSNNIYEVATNKEINPLIDIYKKKLIPKIKEISPEFVFVEIMFPFDIMGALTLNILLKEHLPDVHLNYPGISFDEFNFSRIKDQLNKRMDLMFGFDSVFIYRNDPGILQLIKGLPQKTISHIENLAYKSDEQVEMNSHNTAIRYNEMIMPDYSDLNLERYFVPENVFIDRLSTKCFWSKCSFCSINAHKGEGQLHSIDITIERIKKLKSTYKTKYFWFLDEACPIEHAIKFANRILQDKVDIIWSLRTRIDKELSKDSLKLLYKSGLRELWIGLEHVNEEIITKMNKTNHPELYKEHASKLLQDASDVGIGVHFCHIFGFPSETADNRKEILEFYKSNLTSLRKAPFFATFNVFGLAVDSPIYNEPNKYGITEVKHPDNLFAITQAAYTTKWNDQTSNPEVLAEIDSFCNELMKVLTVDPSIEPIWYVVSDSPYELLFKSNLQTNPFLSQPKEVLV